MYVLGMNTQTDQIVFYLIRSNVYCIVFFIWKKHLNFLFVLINGFAALFSNNLSFSYVFPFSRSPSYHLSKSKKLNGSKEAPLADPEPTSDISNQAANHPFTTASKNGLTGSNRPEPLGDLSKPLTSKALHSVASDSLTNSPLTLNAPCDLPSASDSLAKSRLEQLPTNLQPLHGAPSKTRRTERDRKIVLYILAADDGHRTEKALLRQVYDELSVSFAARGYEIQLCDAHERSAVSCLELAEWITDGPLEARGGHQKAAPCLAEISRHSSTSYVIPILLLGSSLGNPLLPLSVESQDFGTIIASTQNAEDRDLLEKCYVLDEQTQPQCYRLNTDALAAEVSVI